MTVAKHAKRAYPAHRRKSAAQEERLMLRRERLMAVEIEMVSMQVANEQRKAQGYAPAYDAVAFYQLLARAKLDLDEINEQLEGKTK